MGAPIKLTNEFMKNYIAENYDAYVSRSKKNAEKLEGYEALEGQPLKKLYEKVATSMWNAKRVASATSETSVDDGVVIVTPKSILENTIKDLLKKNLTYDEWKNIKLVAEKLVQDIEGKMKNAASAAFAEKQAALTKLQQELEELQSKM